MAGAATTATLLIFEDQIIDPVQNETSHHKPLGSLSSVGERIGRGGPNALYVLGMASYGLIQSDTVYLQNATSMFQASLYSALTTEVLKRTVRQERPDSDEKNSFPSGHASSAFAFASYIGCKHDLPWGIAAYSLATLVGVSRINDNRHYLHDVVAGATIGTSFGLGICLNEKKELNEKNNDNVQWMGFPTSNGFATSLTISY